jgi:hypothetical protein
MRENRKSSVSDCRRGALLVCWILLTAIGPVVPAAVSAQVTLKVVVDQGLPGLRDSNLSRLLAARMAQVGLTDWRFAPAAGNGVPADRVDWSFKLNPYAGGDVRSFVQSFRHEDGLGEGRPVTIEARLYLNGEYQTLVEKQAVIRADPDDPNFIAAVISVTRNLLGPQGAYRAIERGQRASSPKR